jgi:hypothetical protein
MFAVRRVARLVLLAWSVCATISAPPPCPTSSDLTPSRSAVTMLPEVRLRKLHLVRPDLIPYPIAYEVFC